MEAMTATQQKKLAGKLAKVMGSIPWVEKRGRNSFFNYDYATESDIMEAIREKLAEAGVFVTTSVEDMQFRETTKKTRDGSPMHLVFVKTKHTFHDGETGETLEAFGFGSGEDSGDKAVYKAITGAMKYFASKNFLMSTGDDPEKDGEEEKVDKSTGEVSRPSVPPQDFRPAPPAANGNRQTRPPLGNDQCRDFVKDIQSKSGPKKDGSSYTRYSIETRANGFFTTFNPGFADIAMEAKNRGEEVVIGFRANGRWKDVESIRLDSLPPVSSYSEDDIHSLPF